jgi:hypothetical protein
MPMRRAGSRSNPRRIVGIAIAAIAAVALIVAATRAQHAPKPAPVSATAAEDADSYAAPVRLTAIDGERVSLPAGRPGMLMLSSSLCTTCFLTVRDMGKLKSQLGRRVDAAFISVDPGDSVATLRDRRDAIGDPPIPSAIDTSGTLASQYEIRTLGTVVVFDARGRIVSRSIEPTLSDLWGALRRVGVA